MTMLPVRSRLLSCSSRNSSKLQDQNCGSGGYDYNNNNNYNYNRREDDDEEVMRMSRVEVGDSIISSEYCWDINNQNQNQNRAAEIRRRRREMGMVGDDNVVEEEEEEEEEEERQSSRRSNSLTEADGAGGCGSTSKENEEASGWLQLSIGSQPPIIPQIHPTSLITTTTPLVELELLPLPPPAVNSSSSDQQQLASSNRPIFIPPEIRGPWGTNLILMNNYYTSTTQTQTPPPPPPRPFQIPPNLPINMPIHHMPLGMGINLMPPSPNSSFSTHLHHQHYFPTPFHFPPAFDEAGPGPGSDSHVRVVDPPRRPHSGLWFMLQASPTQPKQPFLPQIPKSYLRIKDGRMTVRLLFKYLVNKLSLDSESEIEIRCRGQQLVPFLTLEHVRDNIWSQREGGTTSSSLLSESSASTTDHIMVLHYGRCA